MYYNMAILEIRFSPTQNLLLLLLVGYFLFALLTFLKYFWKSLFFIVRHHWSLCSISLVVSKCFDKGFLKLLRPKKKNALLFFIDWLCRRAHLQHMKAIYNSALTFTSCLCWAWRSARNESLGSSQVSSEHASKFSHLCPTWLPSIHKLLKVLFSYVTICPTSSFPDNPHCLFVYTFFHCI